MQDDDHLTESEKNFLKMYQKQPYHYFRDIKKYSLLLQKLTKP